MKLKKIILALGISTFLLSGVSCDSNDSSGRGNNRIFNQTLLDDYGIKDLKAPSLNREDLINNTAYYCEFDWDSNYYWEYSQEVFNYLKNNQNIENTYFHLDDCYLDETNKRSMTYSYLYASDEFSDYITEGYIQDNGNEYPVIRIFYTVKNNPNYIYSINFLAETNGIFDNSKSNFWLTLHKEEFYHKCFENSERAFVYYTILNDKNVTRAKITNENYNEYFNFNVSLRNEISDSKYIIVDINTKSKTFSNVTFKIDFFEENKIVSSKIVHFYGYSDTFKFSSEKGELVTKDDVKISLYQEGELFLYYKSKGLYF